MLAEDVKSFAKVNSENIVDQLKVDYQKSNPFKESNEEEKS